MIFFVIVQIIILFIYFIQFFLPKHTVISNCSATPAFYKMYLRFFPKKTQLPESVFCATASAAVNINQILISDLVQRHEKIIGELHIYLTRPKC